MKGKTKVAKKMMRGGVAAKKMRGGGMAKMAKKKMMRGGASMKGKVLKAAGGTSVQKSIRPEVVITNDDIIDAMIARASRLTGKADALSKKEAQFLKDIFEKMKK